MKSKLKNQFDRRQFCQTSLLASAGLAVPTIWFPGKHGEIILGHDDYQFKFEHDWAQLPDKYSWQTTHNVAVDKSGLVYAIHEGRAELKDHPSIFVFDGDGKFVRAFGHQFQGGGHGLEVREENGQEFLYVTAYQQLKTFAKLDLRGEVVWQKFAPMDSGVYAAGEDTKREKVWGRDRFMPTNFAFLDDGGFLLADGYGSYFIHRYDKDANWVSCFGGPGDGEGKFNTPHGLWIDRRDPKTPQLVVTDRAHHTLQIFDLDGNYQRTISGFGLPANVDTYQDLMVVPELLGRCSLVNRKNEVVARLGDDNQRVRDDKEFALRASSDKWRQDKFVHPHDACFDVDGNIYVAEWVASGRVSKLTRIN